MTCEGWGPMLSRFVDGELTVSEASSLERHVEFCERCRRELASFRELSTALSARTEADPFFVVRFRARLQEVLGADGSFEVWRRLAVRLLPLAAAALLGAAAAVWLAVEDTGWVELESGQLGGEFMMAAEDAPHPVLQIAFEPFPGGEQ